MDDADFEDLFGSPHVCEDFFSSGLPGCAALDLAVAESGGGDCLRGRETSSPAGASGSKRPSVQDTFEVPPPLEPAIENGASVIDRIEHVFECIVDAMLADECELSLALNTRASAAAAGGDPAGRGSTAVTSAPTRRIRFPGRSAEEAWRFTVILRILALMHEALRNDVTLSKRDIFYRDPALFGRQAHVDRYVDHVACAFGVARSALHVTAAAKGLVAGAVTFHRRDGSAVSARADREGLLVPSLTEIQSVDMAGVRWIVVVEKEASWRSMAASAPLWERIATEGVLVTGKGYPDRATRALLRFLSTPSPRNGFASPAVYGVVDFDPDGLAILSVYKHGSAALAHERAELCVPCMQWLGLRSVDVLQRGGDGSQASQGVLTLSSRDRGKARNMLARISSESRSRHENTHGDMGVHDLDNGRDGPADGTQGEDAEWRRELQRMLMLNVKAELQLLDAAAVDGTADWLEGALGPWR